MSICARCLKRCAGKCAVIGLAATIAAVPVAQAMETGVMKLMEVPTVFLATGGTTSSDGFTMQVQNNIVDHIIYDAATPKLWNFVQQTPGQITYKGTKKV